MQQYWVKIISVLKNCMNSREIQNVDTYINEITEEHLFLRIYEKNSKELSALNIIIRKFVHIYSTAIFFFIKINIPIILKDRLLSIYHSNIKNSGKSGMYKNVFNNFFIYASCALN
jgi:hypothetical protein